MWILQINIYSKNHKFNVQLDFFPMDADYYFSQGPLHERNNQILPDSTEYLSYSTSPSDYHADKFSKKIHNKSKALHHRSRPKNSSSKIKTHITEKDAQEAIMRGLVTETNDIDISKLSGNDRYRIENYL